MPFFRQILPFYGVHILSIPILMVTYMKILFSNHHLLLSIYFIYIPFAVFVADWRPVKEHKADVQQRMGLGQRFELARRPMLQSPQVHQRVVISFHHPLRARAVRLLPLQARKPLQKQCF